jgi:hypothetical protein
MQPTQGIESGQGLWVEQFVQLAWGEGTPEPRFETDFRIPDNKFAFSPGQLNKLFNPKSLGLASLKVVY